MKLICLIPARKNSKGIKNKNMKIFCGRPLIYWTFQIAKKCKFINKIILSTDCKRIADYGKKNAIEVPFLRPKEIANDDTQMVDVANHLKNYLENKKEFYDGMVILQPTSPLRSLDELNKGCKIFLKKKYDCVMSGIEVPHLFNNNLILSKKKNFFKVKEKFISLRHKIKKKYTSDGGSFFITKMKKISKYIIGGRIHIVKIKKLYSTDINDNFDFKLAEILKKNLKKLGSCI
jgi:CMP-N-acetylneuraminic acid synthetase